jgi:hypothetical protein
MARANSVVVKVFVRAPVSKRVSRVNGAPPSVAVPYEKKVAMAV